MHCETLSTERPVELATGFSEAARQRLLSVRGEPLFVADWLRPIFVHYEVAAESLQRDVPFQLDLHEGKAYVTLVAFTMHGMRPCRGGPLTTWLTKPIANNDFLNVRTYVRHRGETGIYFLSEWMNNRFSVRLGPWMFGLPYRFGELNYEHQHGHGKLAGRVGKIKCDQSFTYEAFPSEAAFVPCPAGSLDEFLLERYTAFTAHKTKRRFFRIWHQPWSQRAIPICVSDTRLIEKVWPWFAGSVLVGANYLVGARNVWMGRPHRAD